MATPKKEEMVKYLEAQSNALGGVDISHFRIANQEDLTVADGAIREITAKHDALEKKKKEWTGPLNSVIRDINKTFKPYLDALKGMETALKNKIGEYCERSEEKRDALIAKASKDPAAAQVHIEDAAAYTADTENVSVKTIWVGEVVDAAQLPLEYMTPDVARLLADTKALGRDPKIPGWRAYPKAAVRLKRRK